MFCLGCGTEMSLRATTCPVCGREVAGGAGAGGAGAARIAPARTQESGAQPVITSMAPSATPRPPLEAPGFPRDTSGRVLLLTVIGLGVDLLLPWSNVYGQRQAMIHVGAPAVGLLLLFALAALPLVRSSFRREPSVGMLPLVVGAFCLGVGMMYWVLLYRENEQASSIPISVPADAIGVQSLPANTGVVIGPDVGLFLFLIGSAVLAVVGYQLLLAAAASRTPSLAARIAQPVGAGSTAPTPVAVSPGLAVPAAGAPSAPPQGAGAGLSQAPSQLNGYGGQNGYVPGAARAVSAVGIASPPGIDPAARAEQTVTSTSSAANDAGAQVVLPGSTAWNEAPQQPDVKRHSGGGGWPRAHGRLR